MILPSEIGDYPKRTQPAEGRRTKNKSAPIKKCKEALK